MKFSNLLILFFLFFSCKNEDQERTSNFPKFTEHVNKIPNNNDLWVFILAGQSNMAGRALVEPQDTLSSKRILTITKQGELVFAKEPLHFYEPKGTGLDCGLSFGKTLLKSIPDSISILLIPTAVGGSSVSEWLGDSLHRHIKLLTNFTDKLSIAKKYGQVKAVLWHQGENDANEKDIPQYKEKLAKLFNVFREKAGNETMPVLIGELGSFSKDADQWKMINAEINKYANADINSAVISTADLKDKGDKVHFNSEGQRVMGQRMAEAFVKRFIK